jgi:hypothetical protein
MNMVVILTTALLLAACSHGGCCNQSAALTPLADPVDPDDSVMRDAVTAFLTEQGAPISSMYEYQRVDLDGDKRRDALVLFKNPYGFWCGTHGCTMLIMKASDDSFELVNAIQPVRAPLYVSDQQTNGWRDIIVRVTGRKFDDSKDALMAFDGTQYPDNPDLQPSAFYLAENTAQRVFY